MKEMHFSQQITHIGTNRLVVNHRQSVCSRKANSAWGSDAQGFGAARPWKIV
jgi:hypothetical protein